MLDIYDTNGRLDRGRVMHELTRILGDGVAAEDVPRAWTQLVDLLDECCEGYTMDPLTAPTMVTDYISACARSAIRKRSARRT